MPGGGFGAWLENACLSYAWNAAQRVAYWREEPLEVDGVLDGSWGRWAIEVTIGRVTSRELTPRDLAAYVATDEWEGRAGAYAIQGLGAALVRGIEGDYLNVVGLPGALLVRLLAEHFAGTYGFG